MAENTILKQNENENNRTTVIIVGIYTGAVLALLGYLFQKIVPDYQRGLMPVKEVAIFIILAILSVQSLVFYFQLIVKMRDSGKGKVLSGTLSAVLLGLILAGIFLPYFVLIGFGMGFICWKAGQLFYLSRKQSIGKVTTTYFKRIFISYLVLSIVTIALGLTVDSGILPFFPKNTDMPAYIQAKENLTKLQNAGVDVTELRGVVETIYAELLQVRSLNHVLLGSGIFVFFLIIVYAGYKVFLVRSISLGTVLNEMEAFYKKDPTVGSNPSGGGTGVTIGAILSIIRPFISSVAGLVAVTTYFATSTVFLLSNGIFLFSVVFLTSGYGFVLNDYFDLQKDKITHKRRVLPSGRLTPRLALLLCAFLVIPSLALSTELGLAGLAIDCITVVLLTIYSFVNNRFGVWANAITAVSSSFTLIIGMAIGSYSPLILFTAIGTFFLIFGREIVLDIRDMIADERFGKPSLPIKLGERGALTVAIILFAVASVIFLTAGMLFGSWAFTFIVGILANVLLWAGVISFRLVPTRNSLERFLVLTRIAFLLVIPGLLL